MKFQSNRHGEEEREPYVPMPMNMKMHTCLCVCTLVHTLTYKHMHTHVCTLTRTSYHACVFTRVYIVHKCIKYSNAYTPCHTLHTHVHIHSHIKSIHICMAAMVVPSRIGCVHIHIYWDVSLMSSLLPPASGLAGVHSPFVFPQKIIEDGSKS